MHGAAGRTTLTGCSRGSSGSATRRGRPAVRNPCDFPEGFTVDGVKRLEDKGVTDVIVGFRAPYAKGPDTEPLDAKIRNLETFAEKVITKV
ncbi:hypothetical protein I552_1750 [Mycobacterium xenopi 3993]|nr:hypothetical protein I552_1750 [Mycobacterium xenopi 3993]